MYDEYNLILRLKEGDVSSFEKLYEMFSGRVYNFVLKISHGDTFLAEEIVQMVFVKVWESRKNVIPGSSFSGYVCTIAKNMLYNMYNRQLFFHSKIQPQLNKISQVDASLEENLEVKLLEEYINQLIKTLPPSRRKVYILSRKENLSNKEIAKKLGISENTVESQIRKGNLFLKSKLKLNLGYILMLFSLIG